MVSKLGEGITGSCLMDIEFPFDNKFCKKFWRLIAQQDKYTYHYRTALKHGKDGCLDGSVS